jgi:hypothetical protein
MHGKIRFEGLSQRASRAFGRGTLVNLGLAALVLAVAPGTLAAHEAPTTAPVPKECQKPNLSAAEQARCDFIARTPDLCLRSGLSEETQRFCDEFGQTQDYPSCAWPVQASPEGNGNFTFPDTYARYWWMPFEAAEWASMTITGTYPSARYFSFAVYDEDEQFPEVPGSVTDPLYDAQIVPDPGSINPFVPSEVGGRRVRPAGDDTYTIEITQEPTTSSNENTIVVSSDFAWVLFRLYVPDNGKNLTGGVPLPRIWLTDDLGNTVPLDLCSGADTPVNSLSVLRTFLGTLFPPGFDLIWPEGGNEPPSTDRLWFAAPTVTPIRLFPNPDNKYIVTLPGPYQPGRIIVIHGRAPAFPGTFDGAPVWEPARGFNSVQMRYWSACHNNFVLPMTVVGCATDFATDRRGGDYTIVISNDMVRPDWLRPHVTWIPWGDGDALPGSGDEDQIPKMFTFRNMLPEDNFPYSIQSTIATLGCTFEFELPYVPEREEIDEAGMCAQAVMGDYYPVAAWCDKSTFIAGGWRACLKNVDGL